ncbi:MAG: outer membrane protein assembly factor BamD [Ignavibacteria bacterium]|nr:outer membrane protein assembly factor BamD [Ignavibacteria bacterium]
MKQNQTKFGFELSSNRHILCILSLVFLCSCGSGESINYSDAGSVFNAGIAALNDNDYLETQKMFDIVRLQYGTTQYAHDAQFYLAEMNFKKKDFVIAAFNYNMVLRNYPSSEYGKRALYNSALCYNELSPPSDRDQEYTKKAIQAFSEFQAVFPTDSLAIEANININILRNKLGEREYNTALIYRKLFSWKAALVYYETVIEEFTDTDFYESAFLGKIEVLKELRRYEDARVTIENYRKKFPHGKLSAEISSVETSLPSR